MAVNLAGGFEDQLSIRPISMEEAFQRQLDRVAYLRSLNQPWAEPVFQMRDMLHGLEDQEFYDGLPPKAREEVETIEDRLATLEAIAEDTDVGPSHEQLAEIRRLELRVEAIRARYAPEGWLGMPMRAFRGPGGKPIYRPTPDDLSRALRIILRLADRQRITWKRKRRTSLPNGFEEEDEEDL